MTKLKDIFKRFLEKEEPLTETTGRFFSPKLFFPPGKMAIIGARPGIGRTLFMLYLFKSIFEQKKSNHLYISNEEDEDLLFSKLMTTVTQENPNDSQVLIKDRPADFPILQSENCHIHHHYGSWEDLQKDLEEKFKIQKFDYLYIDKIQGLYSDKVFKNRSQELRYIILQLKKLSHKYQFSSIISSNLNRNVDKRDFPVPQIADLKDTGGLEDFSDLILLLFRYDYYNMIEDENGRDTRGAFHVFIEKNRYGPTDAYHLAFRSWAPCIKPITGGVGIQIA